MITFVLGGTRSGKSEVGERLANRAGDGVTVIVPAPPTDDPDLAARIAVHRERRPAAWTTVECGAELIDAVRGSSGPTLVDSLGSWVAASPDFAVDADALVKALRDRTAPTIVVSEEVGLSVHAPTESGRRFTDALGELNIAVAAIADEVLLVVAGRTLRLDVEQPSADA